MNTPPPAAVFELEAPQMLQELPDGSYYIVPVDPADLTQCESCQ